MPVALSFQESLKKNNQNNIPVMTMMATNQDISAYVSSEIDNLSYDDRYEKYTEYSDPNLSVVDQDKNIVLNDNQKNFTQEANANYMPFKMFRYYEGIDITKMVLSVHFVNSNNDDIYLSPVNVQYGSDSIYFALLLSPEVCAVVGMVTMEIWATGANEKGKQYKLITSTASFNIEASLSGNGIINVSPDAGWEVAYGKIVDNKIADALSPIQTNIDEYKKSANQEFVELKEKIKLLEDKQIDPDDVLILMSV